MANKRFDIVAALLQHYFATKIIFVAVLNGSATFSLFDSQCGTFFSVCDEKCCLWPIILKNMKIGPT